MTETELTQIKEKVKRILENAPEPLHAYDHALRVSDNAVKIALALGLDTEIDMNVLQAGGLLHDVPKALTIPTLLNSIKTHWFESILVKKEMPAILDDLEITSSDKKIILNATKNHTLSYPYRRLNKTGDIYSKIIQDADTMDLFSPERMSMFNKYSKALLPYRFIARFSSFHMNFGFNHMSWFLNYPELAKYSDSFYTALKS